MIIITLLGVIFLVNLPQKSEYKKIVEKFQVINVLETENAVQNKEELLIYAGRETCPSCVEFVPVLSSAAEKTHTKIYYLGATHSKNR
ncbi:hypothetical protein IR114_07620 [Granulicatella sp. 19428wC4_WM01]|nr:hypothetical protein [Granulicatella sp. 19428wC4_WM01]